MILNQLPSAVVTLKLPSCPSVSTIKFNLSNIAMIIFRFFSTSLIQVFGIPSIIVPIVVDHIGFNNSSDFFINGYDKSLPNPNIVLIFVFDILSNILILNTDLIHLIHLLLDIGPVTQRYLFPNPI